MTSSLMAPPHSRCEIENFAYYVRCQLKLANCLYIPIVKIIEHIIPQLDDTFQMETVSCNEMPSEYASYCPESNILSIREDVYIAACNDDARHRFTIAHELGHYFIHDDLTKFSRCPMGATIPAYQDPEWQANVFASAFLMPKNLIRGMTPEQVSRACKTSLQSAMIALKNVA